jgi:hypothetical protein
MPELSIKQMAVLLLIYTVLLSVKEAIQGKLVLF